MTVAGYFVGCIIRHGCLGGNAAGYFFFVKNEVSCASGIRSGKSFRSVSSQKIFESVSSTVDSGRYFIPSGCLPLTLGTEFTYRADQETWRASLCTSGSSEA